MKLLTLSALALLSTLGAQAFAAEPVFSCHDNKQRLEVYQTASGFKGQLNSLYGGTSFDCVQPIAQPGSLQILWTCAQDNANAGRILVQVETGGATGLTTAIVSQEVIPATQAGPHPAPMTPVSILCL